MTTAGLDATDGRRQRRRALGRIELAVACGVLLTLFALFLVYLVRQREHGLRLQCSNQLRAIGVGMQSYHKQQRALPPSRISDTHATWTVLLGPHVLRDHPLLDWKEPLPFIEQAERARQTPVGIYFCPARRRASAIGPDGALGDYAAVSGNGDPKHPWIGPDANGPLIIGEVTRREGDQVLAWKSRTSFDALQRGLSATLLIGDKHVPQDHQSDPARGDGAIYDGRWPTASARVAGPGHGLALTPSAPPADNFGGHHARVCQFLNADGSVRAFLFGVAPELLGKLTTRD